MRLKRRRRAEIGVPPGYLVRRPTAEQATISRYRYDTRHAENDRPTDMERALDDLWGVTWINIDGMPDADALELMAKRLGVHPLVLEDMQSSGQRPSLEDYGHYLFVVFTMLSWDDERREINEEQVTLLLFDSLVITVQRYQGDVLDPLRRRITGGGDGAAAGRHRRRTGLRVAAGAHHTASFGVAASQRTR
jgi:magnesium transporter